MSSEKLKALEEENSELRERLAKVYADMSLKEKFLENANTMSRIICEVDQNLNIKSLNLNGEKAFGVKLGDVFGKSALNFIDPKDHGRLIGDSQAIFKGDYGVPKTYLAKSSEGNFFDILVSSAPIFHKDQSLTIRATILKYDEYINNVKYGGGERGLGLKSIYHSINKVIEDNLNKLKVGDMVVQSSKMKDIVNFVKEISNVSSTVMITGESGTGKELIAKLIHEESARVHEPFVAINCGALPENLLEAELFGYKAGAFTDAKKDKRGKFELAKGGTIFLDEIGELTLNMQVKLLRVLQEMKVSPLGSEKDVDVRARILVATNRNLKVMVEDQQFRTDLFYRIKVLNIEIPPLRHRIDEIEPLCLCFISKFSNLFNKGIRTISKEAVDILKRYNFPGNVRELQHIIEYACIFCKSTTISSIDLPSEIFETEKVSVHEVIDSQKLYENSEKDMIIKAIIKAGGNKKLAAERLGFHKTTLFRKINKYNITPDMLIGRV